MADSSALQISTTEENQSNKEKLYFKERIEGER
jgi:hypothetical protein